VQTHVLEATVKYKPRASNIPSHMANLKQEACQSGRITYTLICGRRHRLFVAES
jgi:hypothetical protein